MPIFMSYNRKDRSFVDSLARNLVAAKHNVWMDRWELSLGDSLIQKIQSALTKSSAILVILSKNSVQSEWCRKELSAGLVRELEEKKTVVMPCVIDDCEIPLFLRDKLYADFRDDPDEAFRLVDRSLAKISNFTQGSAESPAFHTDWALDWVQDGDGPWILRWTFIDHGNDLPYVVFSQCSVFCNPVASAVFGKLQKPEKDSQKTAFLRDVLTRIVKGFAKKPLIEKIRDSTERFVMWEVKGKATQTFLVRYNYRRLGTDNGMDTLVYLDNNLRTALEKLNEVIYRPPPEGEPDQLAAHIFRTGR